MAVKDACDVQVKRIVGQFHCSSQIIEQLVNVIKQYKEEMEFKNNDLNFNATTFF